MIHNSQTKYVSKLQGVSFHLSPFASLFHSSRQCSYKSIQLIKYKLNNTQLDRIKRLLTSSPFSYLKLFGSLHKQPNKLKSKQKQCTATEPWTYPAFQLVKVIGLPFPNQTKLPSSAWSVPDVQKCSWPSPMSLICFSRAKFSSLFSIDASLIPWLTQNWCDLYQFALGE